MSQRLFLFTLLACSFTAVEARAERITGRFTYADDRQPSRPIRYAYVEIWQKSPGGWFFGSNQWTWTDWEGRIDTTVPYLGAGTEIYLRIFAYNNAVDVRTEFNYAQTFYRSTWTVTSLSSGDTHHFAVHFDDPGSIRHFNVANDMLLGKMYGEARRAPGQSDFIPGTVVHIAHYGGFSFFDSTSNVVHIEQAFTTDDHHVLHEYGHVLEDNLSSYQGWGAASNTCGYYYDGPRYAWLEGFPDYFGFAVSRAFPGEVTGVSSAIESPSCGAAPWALSAMSQFLTSALRDIIDSSNPSEPNDRLCSSPDVPNDGRVFEVFDLLHIGETNPNLQDFVNTWVARGYDIPSLIGAFGSIANELSFPTPLPDYGADNTITKPAVWTPSTGQWAIIDGGNRNYVPLGQAGDIPVPADYDGDGFNDLAVWRPSDATWRVLLSTGRNIQVREFGQAGDIPLPGDYDGDGEDDFAVFRPADRTLYIYEDGCLGNSSRVLAEGTPVVGDFNGDGIDDPGIYFAQTRIFRLFLSGAVATVVDHGPIGSLIGGGPVVADFDNDGQDDVGVYTGLATRWSIRMSSTGLVEVHNFGNITMFSRGRRQTDVPIPGDYDGDGFADLATWTPDDGTGWARYNISFDRGLTSVQTMWGVPTDTPVPKP